MALSNSPFYMNKFPWISLPVAFVMLRITTALIFIAHAVVRIAVNSIPIFAGFLESQGFVFGTAVVWLLTVYEIVAGILLAFGFFTRWIATGFFVIISTGIILIHAAHGWFVGEHGTGGMEYSVLLLVVLFVILAVDNNKGAANI